MSKLLRSAPSQLFDLELSRLSVASDGGRTYVPSRAAFTSLPASSPDASIAILAYLVCNIFLPLGNVLHMECSVMRLVRGVSWDCVIAAARS